jgi:hypothetical protein
MPKKEPIRALGLCSGGLDSMLAAEVLRRQGIDVKWISFETPFFSADKARAAAAALEIPLAVENITAVYLEMLRLPDCRYGRNMNPCMDCHALMFRLAGEKMERDGYRFLFSGEVLGQRPMSQTRPSLRYVEKNSGHEGYILRPLSAKKLEPTVPEKEGWVDREGLMDFSGRSRKPQMALAESLGIREYPTPAGGCLLTDKGYTLRLKDLLDHQEDVTEQDLHLLRYGRHLRLGERVKAVVGRTQAENERLLRHVDFQRDRVLRTVGFPGPVTVVPGGASEGELAVAAAVGAGYGKAPKGETVTVKVAGGEEERLLRVVPMAPAEARRFLIR